MEKDEEYIKTVCQLAGVVENVLKQNNAIDIYEELFQVTLYILYMKIDIFMNNFEGHSRRLYTRDSISQDFNVFKRSFFNS